MFKLNPPDSFNFSNPSTWPDWKERFERFRLASKLSKDDKDVQVHVLLYSMGKTSETIFKSFVFANDDDKKDYDKVLKKFEDYFVPKRNIIHERAKFHLRSQKDGENVETFIRNLHEIAENCDFKAKDEEIRDRLVIGILDKELSEKLQLKADLTLQQAIDMTRQNELVKCQMKQMNTDSPVNVESIRRRTASSNGKSGATSGRGKPPFKNSSSNVKTNGSTQLSKRKCGRCNLHHEYGKCFAHGKRCHKCNALHHFAVCCRNKKGIKEVSMQYSEGESSEIFLGTINCVDNSKPWITNLRVHGKEIAFKLDTGADTSVINYDTYCNLRRPPCLSPVKSKLIGPSGSVLNCVGKFNAKTKFRQKWYSFPIHVIKGSSNSNLLSRSISEQMGLVRKVNYVDSVSNGEINQNVFGSFGKVQCEPVKIELKEDATPYCLSTARRVPFPIQDSVQKELDKLEKEGIIKKVTHPTDWCSPMVPVIKKNGDIRICVDYKRLNDAVKRENFVLPTLEDIAPDLNGATVFTKLDASRGFYQIPLDENSQDFTTFITPSSRYSFCRVPFGISSAPEIFQRIMTELLCDVNGVKVIADDVLVYGCDEKDHDQNLKAAIQKIHSSGLKLNKEKCEFKKSMVEYFGHTISADGIQPSMERVTAILNMAAPTNVTELRRVVGMINYIGKFIPNLANIMAPMTDLLRDSSVWRWDSPQETAFTKIKALITKAPVLAFYNPNKPVVVSADSSSYGIGGAIFQEEDGILKPVAYCSRKLSDSELKYAQIEKENLAALWTCDKFSRYLIGLKSFRLLTDHKPLVPLINTQDINKAPLRCQRMLMRLRGYSLIAEHVAGKSLVVSDTLSRSPVGEEKYELTEEIECYAVTIDNLRPISDVRLQQISKGTENDPILQAAIKHTIYGWPDSIRAVREDLRDMFCARSDLNVAQGLLLYRDRIVVPEQVREEILESIHQGHLGINKCLARAQATVWWPGITKDIKQKVAMCDFCQINKPSQKKEPLKPTPMPERPWQRVAADLCELDQKHYLVMTDYYSRYIEIAYLDSLTSNFVIGKMKNIFARHGIPEELVSDNGPQFASEMFRNFTQQYGLKHLLTSPHYPQANGEAESAVKVAKKILKQNDIYIALMEYRATPIEATRLSPAEMLMGRKIRTLLPTLPSLLKPDWSNRDDVILRDARYRETTKVNFDRRNGSTSLPELHPGDQVRIKTDTDKTWVTQGVVKDGDADARSYTVSTPNGKLLRRNRRHLQLTPQPDINRDNPNPNVSFTPNSETVDVNPPNVTHDVKSPTVTRSGRTVKPRTFEDYVT